MLFNDILLGFQIFIYYLGCIIFPEVSTVEVFNPDKPVDISSIGAEVVPHGPPGHANQTGDVDIEIEEITHKKSRE